MLGSSDSLTLSSGEVYLTLKWLMHIVHNTYIIYLSSR